tara:strand:- start:5340 stop:7229 length:1890 start_codon:yes stop_codon:yes gene_type:complete
MPTQSFWSSDDKIPISQTKISLPSENGLEYSGGQRVLFTIPASTCEYFNPINTLLECSFEYALDGNTHPTFLQLDPQLGGSVLIKSLRIYANSAEMPLLEEVQNCNILAGIRYDYDKNDNITKKRALTEAVGQWDPTRKTEFKNHQAMGNSTAFNPNFSQNVDLSTTEFPSADASIGADIRKVKLLLPLHQSGIFGSSVVFPNHLVGGLRLELILEDASKCLCQLPNAQSKYALNTNPYFHSIDGVADRSGGFGNTDAGGSATWYVQTINGFDSAEEMPFCVGEALSIRDQTVDTHFTWKKTSDNSAHIPVITKIENGAGAAGVVMITVDTAVYPDIAISAEIAANMSRYVYYSTSLNSYVGETVNSKVPSAFAPTYTLSDVQLLVERVEMPSSYTTKMTTAMKQGGTINYDFLTFTNYLYSQLKDDRIANIRVPIMNKRCKGTICVPVDGTVYANNVRVACGDGDERAASAGTQVNTYFIEREGNEFTAANTGSHATHSRRSGITGIADGMTNYQYFYDGKLNPSRKVEVAKISNRVSISQQPLVENEKTLAVCGIPPHSFSEFQRNFFISRAVGIQQGVSDLSTTDFNLQVEYTEATNAPTKNKTWNIFIGHLRRLMIKGDSVMIEV